MLKLKFVSGAVVLFLMSLYFETAIAQMNHSGMSDSTTTRAVAVTPSNKRQFGRWHCQV